MDISELVESIKKEDIDATQNELRCSVEDFGPMPMIMVAFD